MERSFGVDYEEALVAEAGHSCDAVEDHVSEDCFGRALL
jgi:hypothetical protein